MEKREAYHYRLVTFRNLLNDFSLTDIERKCYAFSCVNNRVEDALVKKRLDIVLCDFDWSLIS